MSVAPRAIIFDVDGTLAETEEAHRRAFNQAFAEAGLPWCWSPADYTALLTTTGGRERIGRHAIETGTTLDATAIAALHIRKNAIYADLVAQGQVLARPGIARLIGEARHHGIALAIATTTSRSNLTALLECVFAPDAPDWFAAIVTGEDVAAKKPAPDAYLAALSALGLTASDCVAIEDSRNGLDAARACGIATIVTPSLYTATESFPGAAMVCASLDDGPGVVDVARLRLLLAGSADRPAAA